MRRRTDTLPPDLALKALPLILLVHRHLAAPIHNWLLHRRIRQIVRVVTTVFPINPDISHVFTANRLLPRDSLVPATLQAVRVYRKVIRQLCAIRRVFLAFAKTLDRQHVLRVYCLAIRGQSHVRIARALVVAAIAPFRVRCLDFGG
jgi:hypothetical protein